MTSHRNFRQILVGLVILPLSVLPFLAYLSWTPEGRLVRDRALVAVNPPVLPDVSDADIARGVVPAYQGAVMVLAYHGLGSASDGEGGFVVSPDRFGQHLVALREAGMNTVTAPQIAAAFLGGAPLPPKAVMITFDDGRSDAMMFADPLLEQAGMKATMFVITGAADDPGLYYAGWDRLEKAAESGRWDLQSHSDALHDTQSINGRDLPLMTSLKSGESPDGFRRRVDRDLSKASRALAKHTGAKPVALAYPFGAYGADRVNHKSVRDTVSQVVAKHHQLAFQQDEQKRMTLATPYDERTALRRLEVADWSGAQLMRRIAGAASRTGAALAQREAELQAQVNDGGAIPTGLVDSPVRPPAAQIAQPSSRTATRRGTDSPQPISYVAPPPAPMPVGTTPTTAAPQPTPTTTAPPRRTTTTTSPSADDNTPTTRAPAGKSGEPHGSGKNNDN